MIFRIGRRGGKTGAGIYRNYYYAADGGSIFLL